MRLYDGLCCGVRFLGIKPEQLVVKFVVQTATLLVAVASEHVAVSGNQTFHAGKGNTMRRQRFLSFVPWN